MSRHGQTHRWREQEEGLQGPRDDIHTAKEEKEVDHIHTFGFELHFGGAEWVVRWYVDVDSENAALNNGEDDDDDDDVDTLISIQTY